MKKVLALMACMAILTCCTNVDEPNPEQDQEQSGNETEQPNEPEYVPGPYEVAPYPEGAFTAESLGHKGISYIWDESYIPEITIRMTVDEWNKLLNRFDEFEKNVDYFHADITFKKGDEETVFENAGVRLRGNTSRRRPEGNYGEQHNAENPNWHHCHFGINFRKFVKDDKHELYGIRKLNLKWFKDDSCYARELYCYNLFRRYGIWTSAFSSYCRVWVHIEGDEKPAYFGVYNMIEPIDDKYVSRRLKGMYESNKGNLWKCTYGVGGPADLKTGMYNYVDEYNTNKFNWDQDNGVNYTYEFKGDEADFADAKSQLINFMKNLNGKTGEELHSWLSKVFDMEFLLKTYAVNIAVGMWDGHWGNGNNYYLYFNSLDKSNYKVFLIPYDYDNTLGTSIEIGEHKDAAKQDPYKWGSVGILMEKVLEFDDFRKIYKDALKELVNPGNDLFQMTRSVNRIKLWQKNIEPFISNDTGEDMIIKDRPASWGRVGDYRVMDTGSSNFFKVKAQTINAME